MTGSTRSTKIIILVANDTLSVEELTKIAQDIRDIEQNNPKRFVHVLFDAPDRTVEEMKKVMDSVRPEMPFKTVIEYGKKDKRKEI